MMTIDVFTTYINNKLNIKKYYPDLDMSREKLAYIYRLEKKIIDTKYNLINNPNKKKSLMTVNKLITNSIVNAIISVLKYQNNKDIVLHIRNLFDKFPLNNFIISCKCLINHSGKQIILSKTYKTHSLIKEIPDINSIIYKIKINPDTYKTISLILYANGNYIIKSSWPEEKYYTFTDIFQIVNKLITPIILTINSFGSYLLTNNKTIPLMTKKNTKFTEIGMHIFYKKNITQNQFNIIKRLMNDFKNANIVKEKNIEQSIIEYYFTKGMYQFKANRIERVVVLNNYYNFLTDGIIKQKWFSIFGKTRITKIFHRISDIKIEIIGIKEHEFKIFYNFILTLFNLYQCQENTINQTLKNKHITNEYTLKKSLRNLKEQDPVLYNFKKLYKTKNIYSKICQKPYQPILLNKQGYNELPNDQKKNAVKYWNFTFNKDAYYVCPNHKFPYLKFIIKRHPKDYCIPCCKKSQISKKKTNPKRIIYDMCLKNHKYTKEEQTITLGSRYIMSYGKDVECGRLSRLPEGSMEPLFYETYSVNEQGVDAECQTNNGYYIYGVKQHVNGINAGMLNIISNAFDIEITEMVIKLIKLIKESPSKFRILLNGKINKYFTDIQQFIFIITELFLEPQHTLKSRGNNDQHIPWNDIFISMSYLFLNVNIIYFKHVKNNNIKLALPSYITNKEQFLSKEFKNIIILKKINKFYPIYLLNTVVFFKTKLFTKKIFSNDDNIIIIISRLVDYYFKSKFQKNIYQSIDLYILTKFINSKLNSYKLHKLFVNNSNMCYYVHIKNNNKNIFIPVALSYYINTDNINITYNMYFRKKGNMSLIMLLKFIKDYNNWVAIESKNANMIDTSKNTNLPLVFRIRPIYPFITIQSWLVYVNPINIHSNKPQINKQSMVLGFISNNVNYYINDITLVKAISIASGFEHINPKNKLLKIFTVYYKPDIVNQQIFIKKNPIIDNRCFKIGKSIYNNNLYQLLLLEFINIFNNQKNIKLRKKLITKLHENLNKDFDEIMTDISSLIVNCDDYDKIKTQICEFVNNHNNKNTLFNEIDNGIYNFDKELLEKIKLLPFNEVYDNLLKLSSKFITYGNIDKLGDFEFTNMFVSCQNDKNNKQSYCKKKKFIINKQKLYNLLNIMAADILNPVKSKWLFNNILSNNLISFFKFINRTDEHIFVNVI